MHTHRIIRQWILVACSSLLIIVAGYGVVRAVQTARAQWIYRYLKYGHYVGTRWEVPPPKDVRQILAFCEQAYRLYPHNYYCFVLAADRAFSASYAVQGLEELSRQMRSAEYWDRIALQTNPYNSEVCYTHVRIFQENGRIYDAISFWRNVVLEREFWNPDRRDVMVRLYLRAGMISVAIEEVEKNPTWVFPKATRDKVLAFKRMPDDAQ